MVRKLDIQQLLTLRKVERLLTVMPKLPSLEEDSLAVVAASMLLTKPEAYIYYF
jgi:hypothetical protein